MQNSYINAIEKLEKIFIKKVFLYNFLFYFFNAILVAISFSTAFMAVLFATKLVGQPGSYSLTIIILSGSTSSCASIMSFFMINNRRIKNYRLLIFIQTEKLFYFNRAGIYANNLKPEDLLYKRVYEQLGLNINDKLL